MPGQIYCPAHNNKKNNQQIFVREALASPMFSAEWYITDGPDLTHLIGTKKKVVECVDVSSFLPAATFTNEDKFQQLAERLQLGLHVDD
eukprot:12220926-Karenia_brevis.AAC.1